MDHCDHISMNAFEMASRNPDGGSICEFWNNFNETVFLIHYKKFHSRTKQCKIIVLLTCLSHERDEMKNAEIG